MPAMPAMVLPFRDFSGVGSRSKVPALRGWLDRLQPGELDEYRSLERTSLVEGRTTLFHEDDEANCLYRVIAGQVEISVNVSSGRRLVVALAGPEEFLNLSSVITNRPHCVTAETVHSTLVAKISSRDLTRFFARYPALYELLLKEVVGD